MPKNDISIGANMLPAHADKFVHFLMYFLLQILWMWRFDEYDIKKYQKRIFLLVCLYGIMLELIQKYFLVDRFFENYDIIANITGALVGTLFFHHFKT